MNAILVFSLRIFLILISYIFIGWIIYTVFVDLKRGNSKTEEKIISPIIITAALEDGSLTKRFRRSEIIIGRDPSTDFPLQNETISTQHCKITFHHNQYWVEDLQSTNGTYLNDDLISSMTVLTEGDKLRLGKVELNINFNQTALSE